MTLADQLSALDLRHVASCINDILTRATQKRWSPVQLLEHLCTLESQDRQKRSLAYRLNLDFALGGRPLGKFPDGLTSQNSTFPSKTSARHGSCAGCDDHTTKHHAKHPEDAPR